MATRVALIQMSCEPSTEDNLAKAVVRVREAAEAGAKLICLPELFRAQYFCQREDHALFSTAESIPGPSTAALAEVVREHKIVRTANVTQSAVGAKNGNWTTTIAAAILLFDDK